MTEDVHHLDPTERVKLRLANSYLAELTGSHDDMCECELYTARGLTSVREESAFHVRFSPAQRPQPRGTSSP